MTNTDTFIRIGSKHLICQDYAISGVDPFPYSIVSDGCSASKNTDIGSRILTLAAKNFLLLPKNYFKTYFRNETCNGINPKNLYDKMGISIINRAFSIINLLSLELECLDATLIISFMIDDCIYTYVYGDGNILCVEENTVRYINISFPSSAPFYLSYHLNPERMNGYFREFENKKIVNESHIVDDSTNFDALSITEHSCDKPIILKTTPTNKDVYMVSSDGLNSFVGENERGIDLKELIGKMVKFKNLNGKFIVRRLTRFLKNIKAQGIDHYDDISIGGFHIGEPS